MRYSAIVVSGLPGAGKGHLSRELSKLTGWPVVSIGELWRKKHKESNSTNSFEEFWKSISIEQQKTMDISAREIMEKGNIIGEFRFSKLAKGLNALFIFLTADIDKRAERAFKMGKHNEKSLEEIKKILEKRENDEVEIGKQIYGEDYDYRSPEQYSVILDSGELSVNEEVEVVKGMLDGKDLKLILRNIPK